MFSREPRVTFSQSRRTSSPGWYFAHLVEVHACPLKTLWYWPASVSVTMRFGAQLDLRIF